MTLYLGGQLLGTVTVANGFAPYTVRCPTGARRPRVAAQESRSSCGSLTTVWNPHDVIGSPDDRELGVMVDRVTVQ